MRLVRINRHQSRESKSALIYSSFALSSLPPHVALAVYLCCLLRVLSINTLYLETNTGICVCGMSRDCRAQFLYVPAPVVCTAGCSHAKWGQALRLEALHHLLLRPAAVPRDCECACMRKCVCVCVWTATVSPFGTTASSVTPLEKVFLFLTGPFLYILITHYLKQSDKQCMCHVFFLNKY